MTKIVELGGGDNPDFCKLYGNGLNVDSRSSPKVDIVANLEEPLSLENEQFDLVFSKFLIEHLSWRKTREFIAECYRILVYGGKIFIITANLLEQAKAIANKSDWDGSESSMIFGDQNYGENSHRAGWSPDLLKRMFAEAGFVNVRVNPLPHCNTDMYLVADKLRIVTPDRVP